MTLNKLIKRGRDAATLWKECDEALAACNESFGEPYEAARKVLNDSLLTSVTSEEVALDHLKGDTNPLRFEDLKVLVVVRPTLLPVPDKKLEELEARIERMELELKLVKAKRKARLEELQLKGHEFITEKVTTAFRTIK